MSFPPAPPPAGLTSLSWDTLVAALHGAPRVLFCANNLLHAQVIKNWKCLYCHCDYGAPDCGRIPLRGLLVQLDPGAPALFSAPPSCLEAQLPLVTSAQVLHTEARWVLAAESCSVPTTPVRPQNGAAGRREREKLEGDLGAHPSVLLAQLSTAPERLEAISPKL